MHQYPRQDPAQQPKDPSPGKNIPIEDPATNPSDPSIEPPMSPQEDSA